MTHDFDDSFGRGKSGETAVLRFLSTHAACRQATRDEEREGLDAWLITKAGELSLQIKTDDRASRTGNAFVEWVHIQHANGLWLEEGWLQRCSADRLAYYLPRGENDKPGWANVIWLSTERVRAAARGWLQQPSKYPTRGAVNSSYTTYGLCVPVPEVRQLAQEYPS